MRVGKYLITRLLVPLILAAIFCVIFSKHVREPWASLAINLAATFLGSIVTILYIDVILRHDKEVLWSKVQVKIFARLEKTANACISSVRAAFGLKPPEIFSSVPQWTVIRQELIRLAEDTLVPANYGVQSMDQSAWHTLALNLQNAVQETDRILGLFSRSLPPEHTSLLLEIQEQALLILATYTTWPDILGVPPHKLPRKLDGSSTVPIQEAAEIAVSGDIDKLLSKSAQLLRLLPPHANDSV